MLNIFLFRLLNCPPPFFLSVRSSQCADVSSPVLMLKALFFSRRGPGCPGVASRPDCSWKRTNSPSLTVSLSPSVPLLLCRKQNGWVVAGMHRLAPAQSTQPEVTEAWPPTRGLIVEILRLRLVNTLKAMRCRACSVLYIIILLPVGCSYVRFGHEFLY